MITTATSVFTNPVLALTVAAIAATAFALTLAVIRSLTNPARQASFGEALEYIQSSELELDTALNPNEKKQRGWFGYWEEATAKTGKRVKDPNTPGRVVLGIAVFAAVFGLLVFPGGVLGLVAAPVVAVVGWRAWLSAAAAKRITAMEKQLPQLLTGLRANLQAGATAQQAILSVADDLPSPLGDELRALKHDLSVNVALDTALRALADRVPSREMQFLVASVEIAVRSGADLDPQIETIQQIVAQRTRIAQKLRSAVAQVKPTKLLALGAVPLMFFVSIQDEDNRAYWFGSGFVMLVVAAVLYAVGAWLIRVMVKSVENA